MSYDRAGTGEPMLLLHGIGHRRQMWQPVVDRLVDRFDIIAVDLPGFGQSPPVPPEQEPSPEHLADELEALIDASGWDTVHLVGNSLGAWLGLELARRGRARSVTALMPAGLWRRGHGSDSLRHRALFALWIGMARLPGSPSAIRNRIVRSIALAGAFGRPWRIPADVAADDAANLRRCDIKRTMHSVAGRRFPDGTAITAPVTVVLGTRDPLIRARDLDLAQLPIHTRVTTLPGVGHVPTWDDPDAVTATILATTAAVGHAATTGS
jgi:pimeloyl-ACP methyl ester carboxylesterase